MNLYSINTIKQELSFSPLMYRIKENDFSESLLLNYQDIEHTSSQETITNGNPILSSWLEILDYDVEEKETLESTFDLLLSTVRFLGISNDNSANGITNFIGKVDSATFVDIASSVLDILKDCFDPHPILVYLYPSYYALLHTLYLYTEKSISLEAATSLYSDSINELTEELTSLNVSYHNARNYAQAVFIIPYAENASLPCTSSAALYHSYCKATNTDDFYSDTFDYPTNRSYMKIHFSDEPPTWTSYLKSCSDSLTDYNIRSYPITSFAQFLHIGFSLMLSNGMVIRKCKLCNGYFQAKVSSDQMYCSRIYKNTSATCSEVGIRKTYKEKLFQHPIHQEFTKSYNKLYGRIRRGKIPKDTPLMDELKRLHDEYTEKYEHTRGKDREDVWKEYIQKNKDLLG